MSREIYRIFVCFKQNSPGKRTRFTETPPAKTITGQSPADDSPGIRTNALEIRNPILLKQPIPSLVVILSIFGQERPVKSQPQPCGRHAEGLQSLQVDFPQPPRKSGGRKKSLQY